MNGLMSSLSITITTDAIAAFLKVLVIDLMLAGDNAVIIALAAAGLPVEHRRRAILIGVIAATALRIRAGSGGCGAQPYACTGIRSGAVNRANGRRGRHDRTAAQSIPLDRLFRFGDRPIRCLRYDLAGCTGGMAAAIRLIGAAWRKRPAFVPLEQTL